MTKQYYYEGIKTELITYQPNLTWISVTTEKQFNEIFKPREVSTFVSGYLDSQNEEELKNRLSTRGIKLKFCREEIIKNKYEISIGIKVFILLFVFILGLTIGWIT